jgi:hypothetical protein
LHVKNKIALSNGFEARLGFQGSIIGAQQVLETLVFFLKVSSPTSAAENLIF